MDQSPAGLDPHLITAFATFMVVNGNDLRGPDGHRQGSEGHAGPRRILDRRRRTARPIPSSSAPGVKFHNGSPMEAADVVSTFKRVLSKEIASPLASRLAAVESANGDRSARQSS